jgi:hypothetical protein
LIQNAAAADCAIWADRWLAKYSPSENAMIIAEDADRVKRLMKMAIRTLRNPALLKLHGLSDMQNEFGLPLKRIIDTVHFAAKEDSPALQLADLCVFMLGRIAKDKPISERLAPLVHIIMKHLNWRLQFIKPALAESSAT